MKLIKTGSTRRVLLVGKYAIKIPSFYSYRHFLQGLLANEQESHWSIAFKWTKKLCPVLWHSWGYFMIVMPRVKVLTDQECREGKIDQIKIDDFLIIEKGEDGVFPAEKKSDSFGWLNGKLVIIDYGS